VEKVSYQESADDLQQEEVLRLYEAVGWSAYTRKPDALMEAIQKSTCVITARSGERLVGLLRSLSDYRAVNYIQDIIVDPAYQGQGVGRALVERILNRFSNARTHILLTDDEERQHSFYRSLGFKDVSKLEKVPLHAFVQMPGIDLE
jgi:ribosomal protein S18 acetylase RimI-like enzyme